MKNQNTEGKIWAYLDKISDNDAENTVRINLAVQKLLAGEPVLMIGIPDDMANSQTLMGLVLAKLESDHNVTLNQIKVIGTAKITKEDSSSEGTGIVFIIDTDSPNSNNQVIKH